MVTRKPVPPPANVANTASAPYPVSPNSTNYAPDIQTQDARNAYPSSSANPVQDGADIWGEERPDKQNEHPESSLGKSPKREIPESLRVGPPDLSPRVSDEMLRPNQATTNPFRREHSQGSLSGGESSADAWGGPSRSAEPSRAPPPAPDGSPSAGFAKLSVSTHSTGSTNPWQPSLDQQAVLQANPIPPIPKEGSREAWLAPERPAPEPQIDQSANLIELEEQESPAWDEDDEEDEQEVKPITHESQQIHEDANVWDEGKGKGKQVEQHVPTTYEDSNQAEGWNIVDHEATGAQQSGIVAIDGRETSKYRIEDTIPNFPPRPDDYRPPYPPRPNQEYRPPQPPRPVLNTANRSTSSLAADGTPTSTARKHKKETYEIKKITWHDVTAEKNPRVSPILVQNANGPCPLLALVNALTLSTPAGVETALVETLRIREQVSLGLLLDAVFDELMSGRRGDAAQELPDVSDLYSFLITLHTGMNVNPRFLPAGPTHTSTDPRNSMSHIHPSDREAAIPGTFEDTREMKLYSTFSVPLIHGWLPDPSTPAYTALSRSAKSYEDAQNLMFHEEVLEEKLQSEGLNFEEQAILEDISTIKAFFNSAATQLTSYGLDIITNSLAPGAVAILFRNDHFSTLYRHPDTLQLLQLVTDMGYAGHEEVVWESLIDVNGENAEFFSGDFRLVGGAPANSQPSTSNDNARWTTVTGRKSAQKLPATDDPLASPQASSSEQEDHDLALALQLQEEEEERHREEQARRRRETQLSQEYIEQQGNANSIPVSQRGGSSAQRGGLRSQGIILQPGPAVPPRRSNTSIAQHIGTAINTIRPADPEAGVDTPPPSYEQAATQAAYVPPENHPAHPNSSPDAARRASIASTLLGPARQRTSSYGRGTGGVGSMGSTGGTLIDQIPSRRNTQMGQPVQGAQKEKDCIVM